jgi:hypothetical protein
LGKSVIDSLPPSFDAVDVFEKSTTYVMAAIGEFNGAPGRGGAPRSVNGRQDFLSGSSLILRTGGRPEPGGASMAERRAAPRQKSFLRGCIYFNNRRSSADCLIRDISDAGARLTFSSTIALPDIVDLYVPQKEQTLRVHVQWRHGDEIGVAFAPGALAPEPPAASDGDLSERVQKLEAEVAALRRLLRRMQAALPAFDADVA